jgi:hypothetical protein
VSGFDASNAPILTLCISYADSQAESTLLEMVAQFATITLEIQKPGQAISVPFNGLLAGSMTGA